MKNLNVAISEDDFKRFRFSSDDLSFNELKEIISIEVAREALLRCNSIAKAGGFSDLTLDEINSEIKSVRNAKNSD